MSTISRRVKVPLATTSTAGAESAAHFNAVEAVLGLTATRILFGGATGLAASSASLAWDDTGKALAAGGAFSTTEINRASLVASTPFPSVSLDMSATKTWAAGALAAQADFIVKASTHAFASASTETNPATLAITGAPGVGANCTQVNPLAFHVRAGNALFSGKVGIQSADAPTALFEVGTRVGAYTVGLANTANFFGANTDTGGIVGIYSTDASSATKGGSLALGGQNGAAAGTTSPFPFALIKGGALDGSNYNGFLSFSTTAATSAMTERMRIDSAGNLIIGNTVAGTTGAKTLALSNSATAPTASADLCHLYSADNGAGHATLAIYCEEVVAAVGVKVTTQVLPVFINGTLKYLALAA
jgi:hypothetical protein